MVCDGVKEDVSLEHYELAQEEVWGVDEDGEDVAAMVELQLY